MTAETCWLCGGPVRGVWLDSAGQPLCHDGYLDCYTAVTRDGKRPPRRHMRRWHRRALVWILGFAVLHHPAGAGDVHAILLRAYPRRDITELSSIWVEATRGRP